MRISLLGQPTVCLRTVRLEAQMQEWVERGGSRGCEWDRVHGQSTHRCRRVHGLRIREAHRVCPAQTRTPELSVCVVAPSGATRADKQQAQVAGDLHGSKPTRVKASELHSSTLPQALGMLVRKFVENWTCLYTARVYTPLTPRTCTTLPRGSVGPYLYI